MPKSDSTKSFNLNIPNHYNLSMTCNAHGWKNLAPFRWDDESKTVSFAFFLEDIPVDATARQTDNRINATLTSHDGLEDGQVEKARELITRSLGLEIDTSDLLNKAEKIDSDHAKLIRNGAGRLLRAPTLWEDAAKTLFTTNCTWALTKKMCEAACSETFSKKAPSGAYPFPPPQKFTEHSVEELKSLMPIGYRAEYMVGLAKLFSKNPSLDNIETNGFSYKEAYYHVKKIRGFGDYAIFHLLVLSGFYEEIPIDTVVVSYLKKNHRVRKPKSFIDRKYRKWGKYKWWGLKLEKILRHQNWLGD